MDLTKQNVCPYSSHENVNTTCDIQDSSLPEGLTYGLLILDHMYRPSVFFWTIAPLYISYLLFSGKKFAQAGTVGQKKLYTSLFVAVLTIVQLTRQVIDCDTSTYGQDKTGVDWTLFGSYILIAVMVKLEGSREWVTSFPRLLFWLLMLSSICYSVYIRILGEAYNKNIASLIIDVALELGILVHISHSDVTDEVQAQRRSDIRTPVHPEESASLTSHLFMNWVTGLVKTGYSLKLQEDDIPDLCKSDRCETICPPLDLAWKFEKQKCDHIQALKRLKDTQIDSCKEISSDGTASGTGTVVKKVGKPSLLYAMFKAYGLKYILFQTVKVVFELSQFIHPLLLEALINHINNRDTNPPSKGYVLVIAMFVINTAKGTLHMRFELAKQRLLLHMKVALKMAVFKKALTATNESRRDTTTGELVSLISEDVDKLINSCNTVYFIVVTPIQVCLALYMLYCQLGMGAFIGLAIMLSLIPFNSWVGRKIHALEEEKTKVKDERVKVMNEILSGIKVLKLNAWEKSFIGKVTEIRKREVALYKWIKFCHACMDIMFRCLPLLVRLAGFLVFIILGGHLDPVTAFVTASLFNILNTPFSFMALIIPQFIQASISLKRLNNFLTKADIPDDIVIIDSQADSAVHIQDGTFTWDRSADKDTLTDINLKIHKGELVAVVGIIGSGKSSLLSAILGEMEKLDGKVTIQNKLAYVSQEAWIQNATLRDNILFGSEFEAKRYHQVIKACALTEDLKILAAGDKTEIGEKGVNLSGGQKQRVSLARAVYSSADIYLFDDPLSAVDAHVGKHIFNKVIGQSGILKNKTRVLVTHGVHWLPFVDNIIVMKEGRISECGTYRQLLSHDGAFAQFLKEVFAHEEEENDSEVQKIKKNIFTRLNSLSEEESQKERSSLDEDVICSSDKEQDSCFSDSDSDNPEDISNAEKDRQKHGEDNDKKGKIIDDEDTEHGSVSLDVYKEYARVVGHWPILVFVLIFITMLLSRDFKNLWLGKWTEDPLLANTSMMSTDSYQSTSWMYISVYSLCCGLEVLSAFVFIIVLQNRTHEAANLLHSKLLTNVLRLPMSFFDTTPTGRIINRFSKDMSSVDELGGCLEGYIRCLGNILINLLMIMYIAPRIIFFIILVSLIYMHMQRLYIASARQLRRWSSKHSSPVYAYIKETLSGTTTVRAFKAQNRFVTNLAALEEKHMKFDLMARCVSKWFSIRITLLSQFVALAAGLIVLWDKSISPSMVALVLMYSTGFVYGLSWFVYHSTFTEQELVSLERVTEYTSKPTEAAWEIPESTPLAKWPNNGEIVMDEFKLRYREDLDLVLRGVTCNIRSGEKIGIVGRTGAGKSSLTVALFRLVEAASGQIMIDDHQIESMGLHDLRRKITILPQDPMIFGGSLRMNLDPFNEKSNQELWEALKHSHLHTFVTSLPGQLDYDCGEGGRNLSGGQRQLVCLARTLLRKTKVLVLDEATAAVDMETDDLIQKTICSEFKDCTVLTIAHRLNTIMDYDRVLVLDQGFVKEFDSPKNLLANPGSMFYSLAKDAKQVL